MIKGLHVVRKRKANGQYRCYVYAWRGGPCILTSDGHAHPRLDRDALERLRNVQESAPAAQQPTIATIVREWTRSPEWKNLASSTRKTWGGHLTVIEQRWADVPLTIWNDPRMIGKVVAWRDSRSDTPRAADIGVTVLRTLLAFGRLRGRVGINVAEKIPTLYKGGDRAEIIWTADDIARFVAKARDLGASHVADGLRLAALTGLRRQDLVTLTWSQVGDHAIAKKALKKSRGKRRMATVPRIPELDGLLDELRGRRRQAGVATLLVNRSGAAWTGDGFGGSFNRVRDAANIVFVDPETGEERKKHLHDVRGTFCTSLILAGLTDGEAADIMGWSPEQVRGIRRTYVDQGRVIVAIGARIAGRV